MSLSILTFMLTYSLVCIVSCILILTLLSRLSWLPAILAFASPDVAYFKKTDWPIIALTIDDSPDTNTTPLILTTLKQHHIKATFFIISGQISGNEKIMEEIVQDGHELANHLTEDRPSIKLSLAEFEASLQKADTAIAQFSEPKWMRPASGWYNRDMLQIAKKYNYRVALGSIFPFDTHIKSSWFAKNYILFKITPGAIIILHDGNSRGLRTAVTLDKVVPALKKRGYKFVTLSELFDENA